MTAVRRGQRYGMLSVALGIGVIYIQHANRCIKHQPTDKQYLLILTPEDIIPIEIPRQRTKIGFF